MAGEKMSVLYYILIIFGSIVGAFVLGFIGFFIVTYIIDWRVKRQAKKITEADLLKPPKAERRDNDDEQRGERDEEYREFEKLRAIAKGDGGSKPTTSNTPNDYGEQQRGSFQNKTNLSNSTTGRKDGRSSEEFRIY